jgi:hypothetical protein
VAIVAAAEAMRPWAVATLADSVAVTQEVLAADLEGLALVLALVASPVVTRHMPGRRLGEALTTPHTLGIRVIEAVTSADTWPL